MPSLFSLPSRSARPAIAIFIATAVLGLCPARGLRASEPSPVSRATPQQNSASEQNSAAQESIADLRKRYHAELDTLAAWCREQQAADLAEFTARWAFRPHERLTYTFLPPAEAQALEARLLAEIGPDSTAPEATRAEWARRLATLRQSQASALFALAQAAAEAGDGCDALTWANEALREDPELDPARQLFGQSLVDGVWLSSFAAAKQKAGEVWDDRFGWIDAEDLARYEGGERKYRAAWMTAERDAQLHANIDNGWRIDTEHFSITTNHSLEAGAALGSRLEELYQAWRILFADYYLQPNQLKLAFSKGSLPESRRKFRVMYFQSETGFRQALARELPPDLKTTGVYLAKNKTAYFYHAEPEDHATQFHEITHQLFQEMLPRTVPEPGRDADFWLVEAIACYMESLQPQTPRTAGDVSYLTTGGVDAPRVQDARFYLLRQAFRVPLADVAPLGRMAFQRHPEVRKVYAQGGAMADMLMHANGGAFRPALCEMLTALYSGRRASLTELLHESYPALDDMYLKYSQVTDADLSACAGGDDVTYLALAGTEVTSAGLANIADWKSVRWIDLANTQVTDAGLSRLAELPALQELDLAGTAVTDAGLETLAGAAQLRKLTLTGTQVTDAGVARLKAARPGLEIVR